MGNNQRMRQQLGCGDVVPARGRAAPKADLAEAPRRLLRARPGRYRAGAVVFAPMPTPGRDVPVPGTVPAPAAPVVEPVAEPVVGSFIFSELLFTLPGLFILPSVFPPPAGVWAYAVPVRAMASAAARPSIFVFIGVSSVGPCSGS
jgi:hypothetical protein